MLKPTGYLPMMQRGDHTHAHVRAHLCSKAPAICCRSKGQRHWRNLVCWISRITEHLIWILPLYVCIQTGPSGAMKFAIVAQCGCFQTLWHDLWVSVLCVTAQCAHCLSHNAPFSPGPLSLSLSLLTLSDWAATHFVPLANHHHHHHHHHSHHHHWATNQIFSCGTK